MEEKDNKVVTDLKEQTALMYDNTIKEMKERECSPIDIKLVEEAKQDALDAYDRKPLKIDNPYITKEEVYDLLNSNYNPSRPMLSNMFLVHVGDAPVYLVKSVYVNVIDKKVSVCFLETKDFSPLKYFTSHKYFEGAKIEYLEKDGTTIRVDELRKLKVKDIHYGGLSYDNDKPIDTYITFKYKKYEPTAD